MINMAMAKKKKWEKSKSGTTPYPRGASASAPPKGRKEGGQRRATREEGASKCAPDQQRTHVHQQARPHQQQTPQPKGHSRQEPSTQQQKHSGDKRTRSRKDPEATAGKSDRQPQGRKSQHAAPGARAQLRRRQKTSDPRDQATNQ
jgi:hypothetical protein